MILPLEELENLPPDFARSYLLAKGWELLDEHAEHHALYGLRAGRNEYEAFVPLSRKFRDYRKRMGELARLLEKVESRSLWSIVEDLFATPFDVVRFGAQHAEFAGGSLTLDGGVTLITCVRDMLVAASCSAVEARAYFASRRPLPATDLLRRARLGQTERGSYVVKVYVPMPHMPLSPLFSQVVDEPFERRTTRTLMRAARAITQAVKESDIQGNVEPFLRAVPAGVSANMCDALADMQTVGADAVRMDVGWSPLLPSPSANEPVLLEPRANEILRQAGRFLRGNASVNAERVITGKVTDLHRENEPEGRIVVAAIMDDRKRNVRLTLPREDYRNAVYAHDNELPVLCYGELVKQGRSYELVNPRGFTVVTVRQLTLDDSTNGV